MDTITAPAGGDGGRGRRRRRYETVDKGRGGIGAGGGPLADAALRGDETICEEWNAPGGR